MYTNFTAPNGNVNRWVSPRTSGGWTSTPATCGANCNQVTLARPSGDQTLYTFNLNNGAWNTTLKSYTGPVGPSPQVTIQNTFQSFPTDPALGSNAFSRLTNETVTLPSP